MQWGRRKLRIISCLWQNLDIRLLFQQKEMKTATSFYVVGIKVLTIKAEDVAKVCAEIEKSGRIPHVMVDFSHANSSKQFKKQMEVCEDVCQQIAGGSKQIFGVMVESHIVEGRQDLVDGKAQTYGQSITDACIGWEDTEIVLKQLSDAVLARRQVNG